MTDLLACVKRLCSMSTLCKEACSCYIDSEKSTIKDSKKLLLCLSELLLNPELTESVAKIFSHILSQLILLAFRNLDVESKKDRKNMDGKLLHKKRCVALGKLVHVHTDAIRCAFKYFQDNPSPFEGPDDNNFEPRNKKVKKSKSFGAESVSEEQIATACLQFLKAAPEDFKTMWDWSVFLDLYLEHQDPYIRWLACNCAAILSGMCDVEKRKLLETKMSQEDAASFSVRFDSAHIKLVSDDVSDKNYLAGSDNQNSKDAVDSLDGVVTLGDIILPKISKDTPRVKSSLVLVDSAYTNLKSIALSVASGRAVCLQGPVGCGKTALVEHLASVTGRSGPPSFLKVQLGDQIDSKMLLGMYRCTDIPGEFVWQPGVLTQAVIGGHWLLLEDIDSCPTDVLAVLSSLLENKQLNVPGYRDCVRAAPGFQLFLTQRLLCNGETLHRQQSTAASMLGKLWVEVQMEPLSRTELIEVIQRLYPNLVTIASRLVDVYLLFSAGGHHSALTADSRFSEQMAELGSLSGRLISTRDFFKWCARTAEDFNPTSQECALKALQDAIDIFCWSQSDAGVRIKLSKHVAAILGIVDTKAVYFCDTHKPSVSTFGTHLVVGRTKLRKLEEGVVALSRKTDNTFTFTRPASCILERVASCVAHSEPVLLVGETGVGKTSSIQYLAQCMGQKLIVINMNQQSDSADLLGGYKPVELKYVIAPIREKFETLFRGLFDVEENYKFLGHIATCVNKGKWPVLISLMKHSCTAALKRLSKETVVVPQGKKERRKRTGNNGLGDDVSDISSVREKWVEMSEKIHHLECQLKNTDSPVAFSFVEGSLVRALRDGHWVLLDEINLATAETLQCLSGLLEGSSGSLSLLERGDREALFRHSNFRLFAAMNPATNVGKKELPSGLRNRFTEFFVDELTDKQDLLLLCSRYLSPLALPASVVDSVVRFYVDIRKEASKSLTDGIGDRPHYSLRTFCRALQVAAGNPCQAARRSLYEGLLLSFLTQLDGNSRPIVEKLLTSSLVGKGGEDIKSLLRCPLADTLQSKTCVVIEGYPVVQGPQEPKVPEKYILTPTVRRNLKDLVRVVSLARLPILLQGETSVGKTSLIKYLAESSGNRCVRINNHEHTDLQEYIGCYAADENGKLTFKEGVLVEAMRKGYWIILDELNLAPSDVLEALNRVLDDNRELFVTETQQTVKAHPNFMLFGTQNPPGRYGGRKVLSRAFRNRFVEFHLEDIPQPELETILHLRCDMPLSYCKKLVAVMCDLQRHRTNSAAFAGKEGFITLRDLFRWGERYRLAHFKQTEGKFYDWDLHIADEGYLLLAGRVRLEEERKTIIAILQKHIKRTVSTRKLFTLNEETSPVTRHILEQFLNHTPSGFQHIVWTANMRQLAVLLGKACEFKEPVLLVGETGCGKTTICQYFASSEGRPLNIVNCHMHSESADFLGGLRPVRDHSVDSHKLFEWVDGPLIKSMVAGGLFLADEISLAEDSVLERLNSLLEPERTLLLAEKGIGADDHSEEVKAVEGFHFIGTMNPGGDYGKKELSPALRNRFTEIWCEPCLGREDLIAVVQHNLDTGLKFVESNIAPVLVDFLEWFSSTELAQRMPISMRDILTWVNFINVSTRQDIGLPVEEAYIHGACLTFLDGFGSGLTSVINSSGVEELRKKVLNFLVQQLLSTGAASIKIDSFLGDTSEKAASFGTRFGVKPFYIEMGKESVPLQDDFHFSAKTTHSNLIRLLRGMQLEKALLLEGSPGVGKTSLVSALARASGHRLVRINLSDQTDVSDLFGADLPVEGGGGGEFAWRDGPFLQALRAGHWILLDELNLASQSVLEGLNAVLDHRGDLFIPELGQTFHIQSGLTRIFGCQNPHNQGGARKGLPKSFLNRFTQVFMDTLTDSDLEFICTSQFPEIPAAVISRMVAFNDRVCKETGPGGKWGSRGAPWEFNLRDIMRWCQATLNGAANGGLNPGRFVQLIYVDRMRTFEDKEKMKSLYEEIFGNELPLRKDLPLFHVTPDSVFIGDVNLPRVAQVGEDSLGSSSLYVLHKQLPTLQSLARCVSLNWMSILVGSSGCGKSSIVRLLAQLTGRELRTLSVNSAMDTTELLGGFEQVDYTRHLDEIAGKIERLLLGTVRRLLLADENQHSVVKRLLFLLAKGRSILQNTEPNTLSNDNPTNEFQLRVKVLSETLSTIPRNELPENIIPELDELEKKLQTVARHVVQDGSLNAGGRFEWIDSVLVKSLMDGCWLLVDNVNLCSATVLDRLNGLLEPQGVLTIGERGVGKDGNLVTVTPHPDFRLFLTMDSRRGEISRAMRNRGVEVYVLEPDKEESLEPLDRAALLSFVGLSDVKQQSALLHVHECMAQMVSGPDETGITQLLQTAALIAQAQEHGSNFRDAFRDACRRVYIASRISDTPAVRRQMNSALEDSLDSTKEIFDGDSTAVSWLVNLGRLNTADLWVDSVLAEIKQRSSALLALSHGRQDDLVKINEMVSVPPIAKEAGVKRELVLAFYRMSSRSETQLCHRWLSEMMEEEATLLELSAALNKCLSESDLDRSHNPWDQRWLHDVTQTNATPIGVANRIASLMLFTAVALLEETDKVHFKSLSVMKYSQKVCEGTMTDSVTSEGVILKISPFIHQIDKALWEILRLPDLHLSDDEFSQLRSAFIWRHRLWEYANSTTLTNEPIDQEEIVKVITVYVRWVLKRTVLPLQKVISSTAVDLTSLNNIVNDVVGCIQHRRTFLNRLLKRMFFDGVYPAPHLSEYQVTLHEEAATLNQSLGSWEVGKSTSSVDTLFRKLQIILSPRGSEAWEALTDVYHNLSSSDSSEMLKSVDRAKKLLQEVETSLSSDEPESFLKNVDFAACDIWPVMEFVTLRLSAAFRASLSSKSENYDRKSELHSMLASHKMAPPAVVGGLKSESVIRDRRGEELLPWKTRNDIMMLLQHESNTPTLLPPYFWIGLADEPLAFIKSFEESENQLEGNAPLHCPVLSRCVGTLLFSNDSNLVDALVSIPLRDHDRHVKKLRQIQSVLWRNSAALSDRELDYLHNDAVCASGLLDNLVRCVETCCNISQREEHSVKKRVEILVERLLSLDSSAEMKDFANALLDASNATMLLTEENGSQVRRIYLTGCAWALLGLLETRLFVSLGFLDPVCKQVLKLNNIEKEISDTQKELHAFSLTMKLKGNCPEENSTLLHPHVAALHSSLKRLREEQAEVKERCVTPQRPPVSLFGELSRAIKNYGSSIGSCVTVQQLLKRADLAFTGLNSGTEGALQETETLLLELNTWDQSQCRVQKILAEKFAKWYPDIVSPLIAASASLRHGMALVKDSLCKTRESLRLKGLEEMICEFVQFPRLPRSAPSSVINSLTSVRSAQLIESSATEKEVTTVGQCVIEPKRELYRLVKSALMELNNVAITTGSLGGETSQEWVALQDILRQFVSIWQKQEEERRAKEMQEENLYKTKGALRGETLSEEEEIAQGLAQTFPSQREEDFGDIEVSQSLEDANLPPKTSPSEMSGLLTKEDASILCNLHSSLVLRYTESLWLHAEKGGKADFITPWLERSSVAARLINVNYQSLSDSVDKELCASWALAAAATLDFQRPSEFQRIAKDSNSGEYDFYRDSCVDEAKQCVIVLNSTACRVEELRSEWPEHPTLKTIMVVIDRIRAFPLSSPVARFLTGLEILLGKLQEWEENAHSGVSLAVHSRNVTELIVQWRRLELSCWKGCLSSAARRMESETSRWWFHLYSLVEGYTSGSISTPKELLTSLERFMEESPLGEYHSRLRLLLTFHCHSLHLRPSPRQEELSAMLWNLHRFYSLFSDSVTSKISELRSPIEKKIKGFVKIARWNDISFWAIKEAVHKTHHTLHKHIREYEKVLLQPCRPALTVSHTEPVSERRKKVSVVQEDASVFVAKSNLKQLIPNESQTTASVGSVVGHSPSSLFGRARTLTKEAISSWTCPESIRAIDAFAGEVASTAQHLSSQHVDRTLERKKQISHAKNIVRMKRKALADLFRNLQNIGISYRMGLAVEENDSIFKYSLLPPLNLEVSFKNCVPDSLPTKNADDCVISAIEGADNYFVRSVARRVNLTTALRSPHADVGPTLIERLRGFASHLMELSHRQKQSLAKSSKQILRSRLLISQLVGLAKTDRIPQSTLLEWRNRLRHLLQTSSLTLRQFLVLLEACPPESSDVKQWNLKSSNPPMVQAVQGDSCWTKANADLKAMLSRIEILRTNLDKHRTCPDFEDIDRVVTEQEYSAIQRSFEQIRSIAAELKNVCSLFELSSSMNPTVQSLSSLSDIVIQEVESFENASVANLDQQHVEASVKVSSDPLLRLVLLAVQSVFKKRKQSVTEVEENKDVVAAEVDNTTETTKEETTPQSEEIKEDIIPDYKLVDKHFTEQIISNLEENLTELRIGEVSEALQRLISKLSSKPNLDKSSLNEALSSVPLLHQWALLCQSVVAQQAAALRASTKLLSVLLGVFIDVAQKGFCMPEDLKGEEDKKDEGEDNQAGGMGLGDGEGEKDVSDKIESEDQLEGAYKEGEERKEEDKDCKEEEKAIEMSEDFEGKHQDVEPKEGSDEEEDEDDGDDAEKEMGDTGEGAEELDEQIWGSDPEDEDDEDEEADGEEKGNRGEETGEKELAASEDQNKSKAENDEEEDRRGDDKKKEINEMQEPEVDDDHIDPYHGKQQPEEEPEPMDLPDDLRMDEGEKEDAENDAENPFDIDAMKEELPPEPEKVDENADGDSKEENKDEEADDSSDEEEPTTKDGEKENDVPDEEEKMEEDNERGDGGTKDEDKEGDDPSKDEEESEQAEEAKPSGDDATTEAAEKAERMDSGSKDQVEAEKTECADVESEEQRKDDGDPGKDEQKGIGKADSSQVQQGHQSDQTGKQPRPDRSQEELSEEKRKQKPGHSDEKRTLGQMDEPAKKKLKTVDAREENKPEDKQEEEEEEPAAGRDDGDLYEHIQEAKERGDTETIDTATKEQAEKQSRISKEDEEATKPDEEVPMDVDNDDQEANDEAIDKQKPEQMSEGKKKEKNQKMPSGEERAETECTHEVEGDNVETLGAARGPETSFYTRFDELSIRPIADVERDVQAIRSELQNQIATWHQPPIGPDADKTWQTMSSVVSNLAHDLCEQLRLIMEPTQASRLRGDFRTGRRLNMRKVIPYIASQYRKDKIWLRRTKPSKREYQIVLAIDDSSSMADNQSKELAFESVALVSQALSLLEAGDLGVLSFGESPRLVHRLGEPFTQHSGGRLLQEFTFEQRRTQVAALLNFATEMLSDRRNSGASEHAQLLVIVSDGRGIFSEGKETVKAAVQRARQADILVLFLVIDNPKTKDSIFDIRVPEFSGGKLLGITPYMDSFPFPFYLILQDLAALPRVLSDALRQWFELVAKND